MPAPFPHGISFTVTPASGDPFVSLTPVPDALVVAAGVVPVVGYDVGVVGSGDDPPPPPPHATRVVVKKMHAAAKRGALRTHPFMARFFSSLAAKSSR